MSTKAKEYLEKELGRLTLGRTLRSIRLGEEESQTDFAKKLVPKPFSFDRLSSTN